MSDGLRFIRFSVASPAGENRAGMSYPTSEPSWGISTLHTILSAGEALVQEFILQGRTLTPGFAYNRSSSPCQPNTRLNTD